MIRAGASKSKRTSIYARSTIIVMLLLLGAFFVVGTNTVSAAQSGDYTYTISNNNATITGYTGTGGAITIPSTLGGCPVVAIGNGAFSGVSSITSVSIPSSVTSIGNSAFAGSSLTSVTIPSSVTSIGMHAFTSCPSLTGIYVDPSSANYAHADGVLYNKALTTLIAYPGGDVGAFTIPSGVTSIGYGAFFDCSSLTLVAIPNSVTLIGNLAFDQCTNLTFVAIGSGATSIGYQAFTNCYALTSMTLGDNITTIGDLAFLNCTSLTSMTFLGVTAPTTVGANWTSGTPSSLRGHAYAASNFSSPGNLWNGLMMGAVITGNYTYTVSNNNATITGYTGNGGTIIIPSTLDGYPVVAIGDYAFSSCSSLTSVAMPNNVTSIGYGAFFDCSSLLSVTIPNNVTSIGDTAFDYCSSLLSVTIPNGITTIEQDVFNSCTSLASATIPNSVTIIRRCAFNYCSSLTSMTIPNNVTSIGDTAFDHCSSLTSMTIPNNVTSIGQDVFQSCYRLTSVTIPSSLTSIGLYAFSFCTSLTTINVDPDNPNYASIDGVLYNKNLTALIQFPGGKGVAFTIPSGVTTIGSYSFGSCASLTSVSIPDSVQSIGKYAFCYCSPLTSMTFLGVTAPTTVGANWISGTPSSLRGHAYAASNFPPPGNVWNGLKMGAVVPIPPGVPTGLIATPGNAQVSLNWTAPVQDGGSNITNYKVYRGTTSGGETLLATLGGNVLTYNDTGLANGQTYWYEVSAVNAAGEGPTTAPVSSTPFAIPNAPIGLTAIAGNANVTLNWTAPAFDGGRLIDYYVIYQEGVALPAHLTNLTDIITGLINGQSYYFTVAAHNLAGIGPKTSTVTIKPITVPNSPTRLTADPGNAKVTLNWTAPLYTGPGTIYYHLFRNDTLIWNCTTTSYEDVDVTNGVTYSYNVAANNSVGWGLNSTVVQATPTSADIPPSIPLGFEAIAGDGNVTLDWTTPSYVGPGTIVYHLFRDGSPIWNGTATTYMDTPLMKNVSYSYNVAAENSIGWGLNCSVVLVTPFGVPDAPWGLNVISGNAQVSLSWNPVNYSGPGTLTYYLFRDDAMVWSGVETNYSDIGLINGQTYDYNVAASNSVGWGVNTTIVSVAPVGPPTALIGLHAVAGNSFVQLNWTTPLYTGPGTLIYHLFRDGVEIWNGTSIAHNDTGLVNGHIYEYKVAAQNDIGWSANSSSLPAIPLSVPSVPGDLHVTIGVGYINLTWSPPSDNGGISILNYTIIRNPAPSPAIPWVINASTGVTWYNDTSVVAGTAYNYSVTVSNQKGESQASIVAATAATAPTSTNNDWMLYLGIGVIAIIALVGVAFLISRRRK